MIYTNEFDRFVDTGAYKVRYILNERPIYIKHPLNQLRMLRQPYCKSKSMTLLVGNEEFQRGRVRERERTEKLR